ncbi:hypothetical protein [Ferrimicrobium sp.]|uniref:hypothetical protein n=1 Tax=Ferrimicrobium sp. TaxID=2926050 RepID=UPI00261F3024|nr:hypothetical protein [Ferrimicrobium sp.]
MEDARTRLAKEIDRVIHASGKPVSQLAKSLNVDSSSIGRWRRDAQRCPPSRIKALAQVLELDTQQAQNLTELAMEAELEGRDDLRTFRSSTIRRDLDDLKREVEQLSEEVKRLQRAMDSR